MGNLYRLNSLFELEISKYPKVVNFDKALFERSQAFEYLFLILSNKNDCTILGAPVSEELIEYWGKNKISCGDNFITDDSYFGDTLTLDKKKIKDKVLVEWGKTSLINHTKFILEKKKHIISNSHFINSKINQTRWKESQKVNRVNSIVCSNKFELEYALSVMPLPLVIKSEFGFSGRGSYIVKSKDEIKEISKKLNEISKENPGGIIVEEWVEEFKTKDFSGLFELSSKKSTLLAITQMLVDKFGAYRGSLIQKNFGEEFIKGMNSIINSYQRYSSSYSGPISMDGFAFKREDKLEIQYMSEINFRYSMGRVLYDLNKKIGTDTDDCALLFFPVKSKDLKFKALVSDLVKVEKEYKCRIIIVTPLTMQNGNNYPFLGFYVSSKSKFPTKINDSIRKLLL